MDISIIIPTYNRLWSLPKAVESCRSAGCCEIEIIVVDDGSTDGTWEWLQQQKDVVSLRQDNWGKPWAVNRAFPLAKGEYIRFLDSDDWLIASANDQQLALARAQKADLVVAGYDVYDEDENFVRTQEWINCDDFIAQQLGECDSSHYSAFLFRREFIKDIPHRTLFAAADFASRDDRCMMLEVSLVKPKVSIYQGSGFCHRHHQKGRLQFQQSLRSTGTNLQHLLIYRNILSSLTARGELTERRKKAACKILWPLAHWIASTHPTEAAEVAEWIYRLDPGFQPVGSGIVDTFYRYVGFTRTEDLLRFRRSILKRIGYYPASQKTYQFPG